MPDSDRQKPAEEEFSYMPQRKSFIIILVLLVSAFFLWVVRDYIIVILMASIFSALLQPFYDRLLAVLGERHRAVTAVLLLIVLVIGVGIPLVGILSLAAAEGLKISQVAITWIEQQINQPGALKELLPAWLPFSEELVLYKSTILSKLAEWAGTASGFIVKMLSAATQGTARMLVEFFILFYAMFFFLIWGHGTIDVISRHLPLSEDDRILIREKGLFMSRAMLKSILIIGSLQGLLLGLAFWAVGINGAIFWGLIVVLISAIPGIGVGLIWIPAVIYLALNGQYLSAVGLILWGVLIVGMVDNILRPRLVQRDTKMPDLLVLVSTLGGLGAFGAVGIILGPVLAAVMITVLGIYRNAFKTNLE
tara:strand:- start:10366 stop:11460 length:1095 start_codon:yes stop_codon:yes gene_type:complete